MSEKTANALFWVGVVLVPAALLLGLFGFLITPPGEGKVNWEHLSGNDRYDEYFGDNGSFDYERWHHDWVFGYGVQIIAAFLFLAGAILALSMQGADRSRMASPVTEEEIRSWSLPPPAPRRQRRRRFPKASRRMKIVACALTVALVAALVVVPPILRTYESGPKHSAVISVTIDDNELLIWEGEFWVYVDEEEEASGILAKNPYVGGGHITVNITVTWHGNSTHLYSVSCWYDGRMRTIETWVADQQTALVKFDVGFH